VRPLHEESFVEQLKDTREPIVFTYVRRPGYYAAFASAPKLSRSSSASVSPSSGRRKRRAAAIANQCRETAWGTSAGGALPVKRPVSTPNTATANTVVSYPLRGGGHKSVTFADDRIRVTVERDGEIVERIPVFDPGCVVSTAQMKAGPAPGAQIRPNASSVRQS